VRQALGLLALRSVLMAARPNTEQKQPFPAPAEKERAYGKPLNYLAQ
jgi:hypothetical protein